MNTGSDMDIDGMSHEPPACEAGEDAAGDPFNDVLRAACATVALSRSVGRLLPTDEWNDERQAFTEGFIALLQSGLVHVALAKVGISPDLDSLFPDPRDGAHDGLQWIMSDLRRTAEGLVEGPVRASLGKVVHRASCPEPKFETTHERVFLDYGFGHIHPVPNGYSGPARYFVDAPRTGTPAPPLPASWRSWQLNCVFQAAMRTRIVFGDLSEEACDLGSGNHVSGDDAWKAFKQAYDRVIGRDLLGPPIASFPDHTNLVATLDAEYAALTAETDSEASDECDFLLVDLDLNAMLDDDAEPRGSGDTRAGGTDAFNPLN
jgi:hypothetical protein